MQIASDLAGFDMVQVDDIKEAIKHKKSALMVEMEPLFIEGCVKNGISETAASLIWKDIEGYSGYSYNRSHAVAYTFVTYQTARLKYLYPLFYFTALLRTIPQNKSGKEKRTTYLRGALEQGFKVLPPDINISDGEASPDPEKGAIRFGLRDIAGVGAKAVEKILEARPEGGFVEPEEVAEAVNNKGTFRVLCESTTLDSIGAQGTMDDAERLLGWTFRDRMKKYRKKYKNKVTLPEYDKQQVRVLGELFKVTKAHTKGGKPYMTWKIRWSLTEAYDVRLWSETSSLWNIPEGSIVMVHGEWEGLWMNIGVSDPDQVSLIKRG